MSTEEEVKTLENLARNEQDDEMKQELIRTLASYKHYAARASLQNLLSVENNPQQKIFILEKIQDINKLLLEK